MKRKFFYLLAFLFALVFCLTSISFYKDKANGDEFLLGIINPFSRLFNLLAPGDNQDGFSGQVVTSGSNYQGLFAFEENSLVVSGGQEFWVKLFIDSCQGNDGCADVSAASVMLYYNPSQLQVIDNQGNPATSVTLGDYETGSRIFPSWAENSVDVTNGVIRVSGFMADLQSGERGTSFSGRAVFISVRFRTLISNGSASINFDYVPFSDTANKGSDGSNIFWAGAAFEDILNLGGIQNPLALRVDVGSSLSLLRVTDSTPLNIGDEFDVEIRLNSGGVNTVATDVVIDFPPSILEVVDANPTIDGIQITHGTVYEGYEYLSAGVDNSHGVIDLTGFTTSGTGSLEGVSFATIRFKALASGTAEVAFRFTPGLKNESNILEYQAGVEITEANDVLAGVTNLNIEVLASEPTPTPTLTPTPTSMPTPTLSLTPTPLPTLVPRRGDLNSDYCVNGADVSIMVYYWGYVSGVGNLADLDNNGKVNGADIAILVAYWGGFGCLH